MTNVGVLAVQGGVREHATLLASLGVQVTLVRAAAHLDDVDALVLPGGESSVMDRLIRLLGLRDPLVNRIQEGMPVLGTCAGLILLANDIADSAPGQQSLGVLDVTVQRNAFGAQVQSEDVALEVAALGSEPATVAFIRAPSVARVGAGVSVLAKHRERVVAVESGQVLGLACHPELTGETRFHERMLAHVR